MNKDTKLELIEANLIEAGVCPNCWGEQYWEDKFIMVENDRERDTINYDHTKPKALVHQFIEDHITSIRLKAQSE